MSVSYLISSYNKREYLEAVLESAFHELQQTGGEIIIVDDGSTDCSWNKIVKFAARDDRISIHRQRNMGIFNVTNRLLALGRHRWARFIDCDDPILAGSTEAMEDAGEAYKADYVFGGMIPYGPHPIDYSTDKLPKYKDALVQPIEDPILHAIVGYNHVPTAALIRRSAIPANLTLPEDLLSCQDLALALHIFKSGRSIQLEGPVCWQLVGVSRRLSSREALTFHQTIEILKRFGSENFSEQYKKVAQIKVLSRTMRWMRRNGLMTKHPITYASLFGAYVRAKGGSPINWEAAMTLAGRPLAREVDAVLNGQKIY